MKWIALLSLVLSLPAVTADYVSINSGGDTTFLINPAEPIEGIFITQSAPPAITPQGGGSGLPLSFSLVRPDGGLNLVAFSILFFGLILLIALVLVVITYLRRKADTSATVG